MSFSASGGKLGFRYVDLRSITIKPMITRMGLKTRYECIAEFTCDICDTSVEARNDVDGEGMHLGEPQELPEGWTVAVVATRIDQLLQSENSGVFICDACSSRAFQKRMARFSVVNSEGAAEGRG